MRLAYVCTDRRVVVPGPGRGSREILANLRALEGAGHDITFFGTGEGARVPGSWRVVRQRAGNGPKELRDHYAGTRLAATAAEIWSLSVNHRLGRTLEEERQRAPLDGVVERASAWSYAAAAFCHQRRVPYFLEIPAPPPWALWRSWDAQLESAAQAVHAFSVSLATLVMVADDLLAAEYRTLAEAPIVALSSSLKPPTGNGFAIAVAERQGGFDDLKTVRAAVAGLPDGMRPVASGERAAAVVIPATVGAAFDLSPYVAAGIALVLPKGADSRRVPVTSPFALYAPGDADTLLAALVAVRTVVEGRTPPRGGRAARLARFVTESLTPAAGP